MRAAHAKHDRLAQREAWNISTWLKPPSDGHVAVPPSLYGRVFVYSLPASYNTDVDFASSMKHGVYQKAERVLHTLLQRSAALTRDPARARVLWVPLYMSGLGMLDKAKELRQARLDALDAAMGSLTAAGAGAWPARSREHVFACSVDRGRCFQDDMVDRFG